jgi:outer membrane protein assembly factor BamB
VTEFHWPMWGWDAPGSRCKTNEALIRRANYGSMVEAWAAPYQCGDKIRTAPIYFDDVVLLGSHDSKVHGIDVATGLARAGFPFVTGGPVKATGALVDLGAGVIAYIFPSDDGFAYAIDANTGVQIWKVPLDGPGRGSTVIDPVNGIAYMGTTAAPGSAWALDVTDGSTVWSLDMVDLAASNAGAIETALTLFEGLLYASSGFIVVAMDASDGSPERIFRAVNTINTAPAIGVTPDDDAFLLFGSSDHVVYAHDPRNGERRWMELESGDVYATPAIDWVDRKIGCGTHNWDMRIYGLEVDDMNFLKSADPSPVPSAAVQASAAIVRPSTDPGDVNDALIFDAYMANDGRWCGWQITHLDQSNPTFRFPTGSTRSLIDIYSPPTAANGHLFGGREDGKVYAFKVP